MTKFNINLFLFFTHFEWIFDPVYCECAGQTSCKTVFHGSFFIPHLTPFLWNRMVQNFCFIWGRGRVYLYLLLNNCPMFYDWRCSGAILKIGWGVDYMLYAAVCWISYFSLPRKFWGFPIGARKLNSLFPNTSTHHRCIRFKIYGRGLIFFAFSVLFPTTLLHVCTSTSYAHSKVNLLKVRRSISDLTEIPFLSYSLKRTREFHKNL